MRSRPTFSSRGLTIAYFYPSEKEPTDKDKLMISVTTGRSESMQLTTNSVGIGSSLQVFSQSVQSPWSHHSQPVGENRSIMVNGGTIFTG